MAVWATLAVWAALAARISKGSQHRQEFGNDTDGVSKIALPEGYNFTASDDASAIETVVRITGGAHSRDDDEEGGELGVGEVEEESAAQAIEEANVERSVDRIIDQHDNTFILSHPNADVASLTLDAQLIADITVVLTSAAVFGALFEMIRQPTINGYLVAGALVGPGGLALVSELVQVESLAQLGVSLLLFGLGMELNMSKLRAMWGVTLTPFLQGVFIGAILSMSSTSVVVKCLEATKSTASAFGNITIGTLILQDMSVGLMFALLPVFKPVPFLDASADEAAEVNAAILLLMLRMTFKLIVAMGTAYLIARHILPYLLKTLRCHASHELAQLSLVSFCFSGAWVFGRCGLSDELGAFVMGVMITIANAQNRPDENALSRHSIESMHNVMAAMFVASTALIISPRFLGQHIVILTICTFLLMLVKCMLIAAVVTWFGYNIRTSMAVGVSMAHLGLHAVARHCYPVPAIYMLLLGIAALSLLSVPFVIQGVAMLLGSSGGVEIEDAVSAFDSPREQDPILPCFPLGGKGHINGSPPGWSSAFMFFNNFRSRKATRKGNGDMSSIPLDQSDP
eukprot:gene15158-21226_t